MLTAFTLHAQTPPPPETIQRPRLKHTAGSKEGALERTAYTATAKVPKSSITKWWDHYGPGSQFITFEVEVFRDLNLPPTIVTTTNTWYTLTFKGAPQGFIGRVRARDEALKNPSTWMP